MPTIYAGRGITGWRIFAKPTRRGYGRRRSSRCTMSIWPSTKLAAQLRSLGAIGLCLVPEPANGRHIHDRYYDPVWREAEKLRVPICFHPAANPNQDQVVHRFKGHANEAVLINAFRNPIELMLAVGSFCAGGVLERFPKLRVAFLEGNCGWLPWALYRLDERWDMRKGYCNEPMSSTAERLFYAPMFHFRRRGRRSGGRCRQKNR